MVEIYALCDPRNNQIKYIGKTSVGMRDRYLRHLRVKHITKCSSWVKSLLNQGQKPFMILVESTDKESGSESEIFWINYFRFIGVDLLNMASGGEGAGYNNKHALGAVRSQETRDKLSRAYKGKPLSKETIAKLTAIRTGKPWSQKQTDNYERADIEKTKAFQVALKMWVSGSSQEEFLKVSGISRSFFHSRVKKLSNYKELKSQKPPTKRRMVKMYSGEA